MVPMSMVNGMNFDYRQTEIDERYQHLLRGKIMIKSPQTALIIHNDYEASTIASVTLSCMANMDVFTCCTEHTNPVAIENASADLILLDVQASGETDVSAQLQKMTAKMNSPVILLVPKSQSTSIDTSRVKGFIGTIVKPLEPLLFPEQVLHFWEKKWCYAA
ncbi:MAG: hypothetical protein KGM99_20055 [Burkholderiales bacterium]|nr:hypothetical protein [Burkholderiales bacterium]